MRNANRPGDPKRAAVEAAIEGERPLSDAPDQEAVPVGLEHVMALAATHPEFRQALRRDPDGVLGAAALALTSTEQAILRATPPPVLDQMIARVDAKLSAPDRRQFLERAAAALALLVGGKALLGCDSDDGKQYGKPKAAPPPARPTRPVQMRGERRYERHDGSMGIRPDEVMSPPPPDVQDSMEARPTATRPSPPPPREPPRKPRPRKRRPRVYRPASMGVRPRRPPRRRSKGGRPGGSSSI